MEAEIGLSRMLHVYIDGSNNLVMEAEQSVGLPTGGYGNFPLQTDLSIYYHIGSFSYATTPGLPVYVRDDGASKTYGYTNYTGSITAIGTTLQRTGSNPCASNDIYSYASVYSVNISGRFGRRS
jgi:hypothetical protein